MKHEAIKTYTGINIFHRELLTSTRDILNLQSHLLPGKKKSNLCTNLKWTMSIYRVLYKFPRSVLWIQHITVRISVRFCYLFSLVGSFIYSKRFSFLLSLPMNSHFSVSDKFLTCTKTFYAQHLHFSGNYHYVCANIVLWYDIPIP